MCILFKFCIAEPLSIGTRQAMHWSIDFQGDVSRRTVVSRDCDRFLSDGFFSHVSGHMEEVLLGEYQGKELAEKTYSERA